MNAITGISALTGIGTETAEVLAREGDGYRLLLEGREIPARRAFSCLVEPEPGDLVLLSGTGHVLAVLERRGGAQMRLALPDGATLAVDGGRLNLAAETMVLQATTGQVAMDTVNVNATRADARIGRLGLVAEAIETLAQRIIGRFRRSYRFVEESEHLRARDIEQRASGHLGLKGDTATIQAGVVVKVDAAQIHMG